MKEKVIIFGAGKLYRERVLNIQERCEIVAILDNMADKMDRSAYPATLYTPDKLLELDRLPIIILSDFINDMIIQISKIIGDDECNQRVKIGRFYFPITDMEKQISNEKVNIKVSDNRVYFILNDGDEMQLKDIYRLVSQKNDTMMQEIIKMHTSPIDELFGHRRGKPIDRYYIETFLEKNKECVTGRCLEIAENTYTKEFGQDRVTESMMLHVEGWGDGVVKGNLETGEGIEENSFDTMIITQTLMYIYDVKATVENIYKGLRENGTALITVSGISKIARYDDDNWGMFHSFYMSGLKKLFYPIFGEGNVEIIHYGNVKTAIAFLYGGTVEELTREDFDFKDMDYPVIYGIVARKKNVQK